MLLGLRKVEAMGVKIVVIKSDSQVITCHVDKTTKAIGPTLEKYVDMVQRMEASFEGFTVNNILRLDNEHVDILAKSVAQGLSLSPEVFFEILKGLGFREDF